MKKLQNSLLAAALIFSMNGVAHASINTATTATFAPSPVNLNDLDHAHYYTWGISLDVDLTAVYISKASITFSNIHNYDNNAYALWLQLLPSAGLGVTTGDDSRDTKMANAFNGIGTPLTEYTYDGNGGLHDIRTDYEYTNRFNRGIKNVTYTFDSSELAALNADVKFASVIGLGFDPDCHFYNSGISFSITTALNTPTSGDSGAVPEPATMLLFGTGLAGLAGIRLRRKKN